MTSRIVKCCVVAIIHVLSLSTGWSNAMTTTGDTVEVLFRLKDQVGFALPDLDSILVSTDSTILPFKDVFSEHEVDSITPTFPGFLDQYYSVYISGTCNVDSLLSDLNDLESIDVASRMPMLSPMHSSSDAYQGGQWWLDAIRAYQAFDKSEVVPAVGDYDFQCKCTPEPNEKPYVTIAVLDNAFSTDHEELSGIVTETYSENSILPASSSGLVDLYELASTSDGDLHGTAVATVALGKAHNGVGIIGMGHGARMIAIDIVPNTPNVATVKDAVKGAIKAVELKADVILMSWGKECVNCSSVNDADAIEARLVAKAWADFMNEVETVPTMTRGSGLGKKPIVVVAAGNKQAASSDASRKNPVFPAQVKGVIAVGNVLIGGHVSNNSMIGVAPEIVGNSRVPKKISSSSTFQDYQNLKPFVDFYAPGENMLVGMVTNPHVNYPTNENRYSVAAGTSYSAPVVAGLIARMLMIDADLNQNEIITALRSGSEEDAWRTEFYNANYLKAPGEEPDDPAVFCTVNVGEKKDELALGYGLINAQKAIEYVMTSLDGPGCLTTPAPPSLKLFNGNQEQQPYLTQLKVGTTYSVKLSQTSLPNGYEAKVFYSTDKVTPFQGKVGTISASSLSVSFTPHGAGVFTLTYSMCIPNCKTRYVNSISFVVAEVDPECELFVNGSFEKRVFQGAPLPFPTLLNANRIIRNSIDQPILASSEGSGAGLFAVGSPKTDPWFRNLGQALILPSIVPDVPLVTEAHHGTFYAKVRSNLFDPISVEDCNGSAPSDRSSTLTVGEQRIAIPFKFVGGKTYEICYVYRKKKFTGDISNPTDPENYNLSNDGHRLFAMNGVTRSVGGKPYDGLAFPLLGQPSITNLDLANPWSAPILSVGNNPVPGLNRWYGSYYLSKEPAARSVIFQPQFDYDYLVVTAGAAHQYWELEIDNIRAVTSCAYSLPDNVRVCSGDGANISVSDNMPSGLGLQGITWTMLTKLDPVTGLWLPYTLPDVTGKIYNTGGLGVGVYQLKVIVNDQEKLCYQLEKIITVEIADCGTGTPCTDCDELEVRAVPSTGNPCCYALYVDNNDDICVADITKFKFDPPAPVGYDYTPGSFNPVGGWYTGNGKLKPGGSMFLGTFCVSNGANPLPAELSFTFGFVGGTTCTTAVVELQAPVCNSCCPGASDVTVVEKTWVQDPCVCRYKLDISKPGCNGSFVVWIRSPFRWQKEFVTFGPNSPTQSIELHSTSIGEIIHIEISRSGVSEPCSSFDIELEPCEITITCATFGFTTLFSGAQYEDPQNPGSPVRCCAFFVPNIPCGQSDTFWDQFSFFIDGVEIHSSMVGNIRGIYVCFEDVLQFSKQISIRRKGSNVVICTKTLSANCLLGQQKAGVAPLDIDTLSGEELSSGDIELRVVGQNTFEIVSQSLSSDQVCNAQFVDLLGRSIEGQVTMVDGIARIVADRDLVRGLYLVLLNCDDGTTLVRKVIYSH